MIDKCRSCKSDRIEDVFSLGDQYLSEFTDTDKKGIPYPLDLVICRDCSLLQLKHTVPSSKLYTDNYGYYSGINNTMREHLSEIANKAQELVQLYQGDVVVDIGSNDATLLKNYDNQLIRIGFDLVPKFKKHYEDDNLYFVNRPFSKEVYFDITADLPVERRKPKIITAISMFYDLDDPNQFVKDIRETLHEDGVFIIQQNYLVGMLKRHAFDNVVHEHLEYYSLYSLEKLLHRHGLEVFDVDLNDLNGGSFRTYIKHMNKVRQMRVLEQNMKLSNKMTYAMFGMKAKNTKTQLVKFIEEVVKDGKTVYVYGASTRGNTILQYCGLTSKLIKAAVERNPDKWGKFISSVGIPIISEEQARKEKPDYMLVLPWFFKDEFIKREKDYVMGGGALIFPMPEFHVITKNNYSKYI